MVKCMQQQNRVQKGNKVRSMLQKGKMYNKVKMLQNGNKVKMYAAAKQGVKR